MIDIRLGDVNNTLNSSIVDFIANGGTYKSMWYEWNGCCNSSYNRDRINEILEDLGYGSNTYVPSGTWRSSNAVTISNPNISGTTFNYDDLPSSIAFTGTYHEGLGSSIASGCNLLTSPYTGLMICDPAAKSSSQTHTGTIVGSTDINWQNEGSYRTSSGYEVMKWILALHTPPAPRLRLL